MTSNRRILAEHSIRAKKRMGQHFLEADSVRRAIVDLLEITNDDVVLEIGPGLGALTIPMARLAKRLFAIEKDCKLVEVLRTRLLASKITNVELVTNDFLKVDLSYFYNDVKQSLILVGNLPYNISSHVLVKTVQNRSLFKKKVVFMLQKEVAERICSKPGSKEYSRLSVILQYYAEMRVVFNVQSSMFFPKPKIDSSIVEISFLSKPKIKARDEIFLLSVIKAAFGKRRKTLKNSLSESHLNVDARMCEAVLSGAGIDPMRRAETLSVEEFVLLSNCFNKKSRSVMKFDLNRPRL